MQKSRAIPLPRTGDSNKQNGRWTASFGRSHRCPNMQEKKEEKKAEGSLVKGMAERRTERGVFRQLLEELRLEDEESYRRYLRLNTEHFR